MNIMAIYLSAVLLGGTLCMFMRLLEKILDELKKINGKLK